MDGHFKLPREILLDDGRRARVTIAVMGRNGFLLREVSIAHSESTEAYVNALSPILAARYANGLRPPHGISDNPGMIQGEYMP